MDQFLIALVGAIIGGLVAIFGSFKLDTHQSDKRKRNLRTAISAEVASIVELIRRQQYSDHLRAFAVRVLNFEATKSRVFTLPVCQSYFSVYEQNTGGLGELDTDEVVAIIGFYQQARSILDTVLDTAEPGSEITNAEIAKFYEGLARYVDNLSQFGDELVGQLTTAAVRDRINETASRLIAIE